MCGCYDIRDRIFLFFFSSRRRHTRLQGDWSSDVCSSDLVEDALEQIGRDAGARVFDLNPDEVAGAAGANGEAVLVQIGRGAGRGRGEISVGAVSLKKKKRRKKRWAEIHETMNNSKQRREV